MIQIIHGGAVYILENFNVKNIVIGVQAEKYANTEKVIEIARKNKINIIVLSSENVLNIDEYTRFEAIFPRVENTVLSNKINNNSLVLKFIYKDFSVLFTGDIEEEAENVILQNYKNNLKALDSMVLKVAHHGSKTSSTEKFLNAVKPKIALIGVGANNTFGHPSASTLENLENLNCKVYRTDQNGEISIRVNRREEISIKTMLD